MPKRPSTKENLLPVEWRARLVEEFEGRTGLPITEFEKADAELDAMYAAGDDVSDVVDKHIEKYNLDDMADSVWGNLQWKPSWA